MWCYQDFFLTLTSAAPRCLGAKVQILWELLGNGFDAAGSPPLSSLSLKSRSGRRRRKRMQSSLHPSSWSLEGTLLPAGWAALQRARILTPNIQECPALGEVFFAVRRAGWEECWKSRWTPVTLKKRLFICRQISASTWLLEMTFKVVFLT